MGQTVLFSSLSGFNDDGAPYKAIPWVVPIDLSHRGVTLLCHFALRTTLPGVVQKQVSPLGYPPFTFYLLAFFWSLSFFLPYEE